MVQKYIKVIGTVIVIIYFIKENFVSSHSCSGAVFN